MFCHKINIVRLKRQINFGIQCGNANRIMRLVIFGICFEDKVGLHRKKYPVCEMNRIDLVHAQRLCRHYLFGDKITGNEGLGNMILQKKLDM